MRTRLAFFLLGFCAALLLAFSGEERRGVMIYPDGYYHYFETLPGGKAVYRKARADSFSLCPN